MTLCVFGGMKKKTAEGGGKPGAADGPGALQAFFRRFAKLFEGLIDRLEQWGDAGDGSAEPEFPICRIGHCPGVRYKFPIFCVPAFAIFPRREKRLSFYLEPVSERIPMRGI